MMYVHKFGFCLADDELSFCDKEWLVIVVYGYIRKKKNQQYALICTTPLFYVLAPTCFGSRLPSSGSVLEPSELHEIQIE
jgi:hypothetical protein